MNLFGLEGSGFVIALGLILLFSGMIMFYSLKRFAILENSIIEQGKILHTFINKMQINNSKEVPLANEIAVQSAGLQQKKIDEEKNDTISVSDDESDNSEEDVDIIEESNNNQEESEEEDEEDLEDNEEYQGDEEEADDEDEEEDKDNNSLKMKDVLDIKKEENNNLVKIISLDNIDSELNPDINQSLKLVNTDSDSNSDSCSENNFNNEEIEIKKEIIKGGISKMKVGKLRELVIEKGLIENLEDLNKMKKESLIRILQEN